MGNYFQKCCRSRQEVREVWFTMDGHKYPNNSVDTTKYNFITFFPKAILLQFLKPAYWVYLTAAVAQSLPDVGSFSPAANIAPLIFVLILALLKEGIEDYKRHKKDSEINNMPILAYRQGEFKQQSWCNLHVGDFIKIVNDQFVPADCLLLVGSGNSGHCYVQTSNLDGETNLKIKNAILELKQNQLKLQQIKGRFVIEAPNSQLHEFHGEQINEEGKSQNELSFSNILLRGSQIKNTQYAIGFVIYTGHDTKIMHGIGQINHKTSQIERKVNKIHLILLIILILISVLTAILYYVYHTQFANHNRTDFFYLVRSINRSIGLDTFLRFLAAFLLMNFLIPISLNIILEAIKLLQGLFISFDKKMYHVPTEQNCNPLNMSIIQQLGLVDYILTDKTGTLTLNQMKLKKIWVNGSQYQTNLLKKQKQNFDNADFYHFWEAAIICHDTILNQKSKKYQGSSPDQVCFVQYASEIGFKFLSRTKDVLQVQIFDQKCVYEYLHTIQFSSRKKMSVIVRDYNTSKIIMFTKGADSAIRQCSKRIAKQTSFQQHLSEFSTQGLRTLVFARKQLTQEQYQNFMKQIGDLNKDKIKKKDQQMKGFNEKKELDAINSLEKDLTIIGLTGVEDKLQAQVPQTIARLKEANVKMMMITGDKLQTAQNIGLMCKMLTQSKIFKIREKNKNVTQQIQIIHQDILTLSQEQNCSIIIEGKAILDYLQYQNTTITTTILQKSNAVIFCRSSPKDKTQIVKWVRQKMNGIVLAIGDGGNDVGMIQQANVGVGIIGKQGNEAAANSDFYFARFRYLDRLLLHHGRWNYYRMAYYYVYYSWKNFVYVVLLYIYLFYSAYSSILLGSSFYFLFYQLTIATFIAIYYSVLQQDVNSDIHPQVKFIEPKIYKQFKELDLFSYKRYLLWMFLGIVLGVLIFYINYLSLGSTILISANGRPCDYITLGSAVQVELTIIMIAIIVIDMNNFTWFSGLFFVGFITIFIAIICLLAQNFINMGQFGFYGGLTDNFNLRFWLTVLLCCSIPIVTKIAFNAIMFIFFPNSMDQFRQKQSDTKRSNQIANNMMQQTQLQIFPKKRAQQYNQQIRVKRMNGFIFAQIKQSSFMLIGKYRYIRIFMFMIQFYKFFIIKRQFQNAG